MPRLVRLYIDSVLIGFVIAVAFVALLLWQDVAGLRSLIEASDMALSATLLLVFQHGTVFASMQFAFAIMMLADDAGPRGGLRQRTRAIPIKIPVDPQLTVCRWRTHSDREGCSREPEVYGGRQCGPAAI